MKTITNKILYPFTIMLILVPVITLILFNIAMQFYIANITITELKNTIKTMYSLLDSQSNESTSSEIQDLSKDLASALTASKLTANTDFFILDHHHNIIYPRNFDASIINNELQELVKTLDFPHDGSIQKVKHDQITYFLSALPLKQFKKNFNLTILFLSNDNNSKNIVHTINLILISIFTVIIFFSIILSKSITKKISQPIIDSCAYATQIGNGNFISVPIDANTTEIYQFCISLNQMSARLKAYDSAQKQFLQNVSHELRTPLMSIQGYAEGIENGILTNDQSAATIIRKESIRLNNLVNELLTLSRIENQTYSGQLISQNISNLLLDCSQRVNGLAIKEQITLKLDLEKEVIASVDESLFSQLIINIISNCIRYAASTITIKAYMQNEIAIIKIFDDGNGFNKEDLPHLFDRFYKGEKGNFGLGLAIAKSATEYMKGTITPYNDNGAVFQIEFKQ